MHTYNTHHYIRPHLPVYIHACIRNCIVFYMRACMFTHTHSFLSSIIHSFIRTFPLYLAPCIGLTAADSLSLASFAVFSESTGQALDPKQLPLCSPSVGLARSWTERNASEFARKSNSVRLGWGITRCGTNSCEGHIMSFWASKFIVFGVRCDLASIWIYWRYLSVRERGGRLDLNTCHSLPSWGE